MAKDLAEKCWYDDNRLYVGGQEFDTGIFNIIVRDDPTNGCALSGW
jgi:hypothetical protein